MRMCRKGPILYVFSIQPQQSSTPPVISLVSEGCDGRSYAQLQAGARQDHVEILYWFLFPKRTVAVASTAWQWHEYACFFLSGWTTRCFRAHFWTILTSSEMLLIPQWECGKSDLNYVPGLKAVGNCRLWSTSTRYYMPFIYFRSLVAGSCRIIGHTA